MQLTELQVEKVHQTLYQKGMRLKAVKSELIDHVCCLIEVEMEAGKSFEEAYEQAIIPFDSNTLKTLQHEVLFTTNQTLTTMLKATFLASLMVIGTYFFFAQDQSGETVFISEVVAPLKGEIKITSGFGMRMDPIAKQKKLHSGVDFRSPLGTPVYATEAGTITQAGVHPQKVKYGIMIDIAHLDERTTRFAHLQDLSVTQGQEVVAGDLIGHVGNSGASMGPHLHFELREKGKAVDPAGYLSLD